MVKEQGLDRWWGTTTARPGGSSSIEQRHCSRTWPPPTGHLVPPGGGASLARVDSGGGGGLGPSQRQIRGLRIPEHPTFEDCILSYPSADHRTTSPNMGRSAKMKMRPTQKQKQVSKIAKAAAQPLKKRDPSPEPVVAPSGGGGKKKRKSMRVKADKVSSWPPARRGSYRSLFTADSTRSRKRKNCHSTARPARTHFGYLISWQLSTVCMYPITQDNGDILMLQH